MAMVKRTRCTAKNSERKFFTFAKLAPREKEEVVEELSQRSIDLVLVSAKVKVEEAMVIIDKGNLWENSRDITINIPVQFCFGDVLQVVSRVRRKKIRRYRKK
jgi:hypothetical protein